MSVGIDLVHIPSFSEQLSLDGTTFLYSFTVREISDSKSGVDGDNLRRREESLAGKWAAKEAFVKAWSGLLVGKESPINPNDPKIFADIEIVKDVFSRPTIELHGEVANKFNADYGTKQISVSISHDADYAIAICQIS